MIETEVVNKIESMAYITRANLELLVGSNRRTVDSRIKSLIRDGKLLRIKKGFYLSPKYLENEATKEAYLEYLGSIVKSPSYVSLRYALSKYNLIPESVTEISFVTLKKPKLIVNSVINFSYRKIKNELFLGFTTINYKDKTYFFAKPYKALFDFVYFSKLSSKEDFIDFVKNSRINWDVLDKENRIELQKILKQSNSNKMRLFLEVLRENQLLPAYASGML